MSDMIDDPRIRRLIKQFGADGYAVYNLVLERVTKRLESASPLPDLEESSTDLADLLNMDAVRVEEIIWHCIGEDLLQQNEIDGRILVHKIYKFLESGQTRSVDLKQMIAAYHGMSQTVSDSLRLSMPEKKRTEEKRREEKREKSTHAIGVLMNQTRYDNLCGQYGSSLVDLTIQKVADWAAEKGKVVKDHAAAAGRWLAKDYPNGPPKQPKAGVKTRGEMRKELGI